MGKTAGKRIALRESDTLGEAQIVNKLSIIFEKSEEKNIPEGWSEDLIYRCCTAQSAEVHLPGKFYTGSFVDIYRNEESVVVCLRVHFSAEDSQESRIHKFKFKECKKPVFIKEDDWDCMWFGFSNGHVVIYFQKPKESDEATM